MSNIKSKSPKRKLKLELIEGKTYMLEKDVLHYYKDSNWNISDFMTHFSLGHRIVRRSIAKYISKEDRSKLRGSKTRNSQLASNSNSINWYKPRHVIEIDILKEAINKSKNQSELLNNLGITKYVLTSNLQYHNLPLPTKKADGSLSVHDLNDNDIRLLKKLVSVHEGLGLLISNSHSDIAMGTVNLSNLAFELKLLSRKVRRYNRNILRAKGINFPANLVEYCFKEALESMGINYRMQVKIGTRSFDFLLEEKLIVELDGHLHTKLIDKEKNDLAKTSGYRIVRLHLKKLKLIRFKQKEDFILCIEKYVLPVLNQ